MMNQVEQMHARIAKKGIYASDIKQTGLLSDDQIADIPFEKIYEWIKTHQWRQRDFKQWLTVMRVIEK
jgi:hypothetical protein